jgi:hypothetical protein
MSSSVACPDGCRRINAIAANAAMPTIHLTPRLHRDVCFFFSPRREFRPARDGCWELLGTPYAPKEEEFPYLCRLKKCAAHQARQDGATAIMTRRRHYAARSLGVSALSIERRCRSVVWHRKKVRFITDIERICNGWLEEPLSAQTRGGTPV